MPVFQSRQRATANLKGKTQGCLPPLREVYARRAPVVLNNGHEFLNRHLRPGLHCGSAEQGGRQGFFREISQSNNFADMETTQS